MEQKQSKGVIHGLRINAELKNRIERRSKQANFQAAVRSSAPPSSGNWPAEKAASMRQSRESLRVWIERPEKFTICG